ncbi:hypothetical protein [Vibrio sp.]
MVAPESEMSAVGHAITLTLPLSPSLTPFLQKTKKTDIFNSYAIATR